MARWPGGESYRIMIPRMGAIGRHSLTRIDVCAEPGNRRRGWIVAGSQRLAVALGRSGITANKREGDGATPMGSFRPLRVWWRKDRGPRPAVLLPCRPIGPADGWCEDPRHRRYNRPIRLSAGATGDRLARADALYDVFVEIDHNTRPRVAGRGSAVFIHVARPNFGPTAGCIAMPAPVLRRLVRRLGPNTKIVIHA